MNTAIHRIVKGDCLEVMKKIPNNIVDFVCSDFPYNISNRNGLTMANDKIIKADFGEWDKWDSEEEYLNFVFDVCLEYKRVLKPNANLVLFFGYKHAGWIAYELQRLGRFSFRQPIIFQKLNPIPHVKKNGFRSCHEMGVRLVNDGGEFKKPTTFNFLEQNIMKNVMGYKIGQNGEKETSHPTEKPIRLITTLIDVFTKPGDIVLDSFAGSGTTGIASYRLGRHCISIEKNQRFAKMIQNRQDKEEKGD